MLSVGFCSFRTSYPTGVEYGLCLSCSVCPERPEEVTKSAPHFLFLSTKDIVRGRGRFYVKMVISVIVPCYKGERHIASCLENLLGQNYQMELEIIVVIDGDVDKSASIARNYPVKVIVLEKNQGLSAARNIGLDASTGDYVHFMDVDDKINGDFYANMSVALFDTDADIACSGMFNDSKPYKCQIFNKMKVYSRERERMSITWVIKWGYVWRYIFRRRFLIDNNLKFEVGRLIEDRYFSFQALYFAKKIVTVPGSVYTYRNTEGSIMNIKDREWRERIHADKKHSDVMIKEFAKHHHILVPGSGLNFGTVKYIVRKYYITIMASIFRNYYRNPNSPRYS